MIDFIKINRDVNGNPRYVVHFLNFANDYGEAVKIAKKLIGGKRFHNKQYGGGIVFSSYNVNHDLKLIENLKKDNDK